MELSARSFGERRGRGKKKPLESKANEFLKWDKKWIEIRIILFSARFNRVE